MKECISEDPNNNIVSADKNAVREKRERIRSYRFIAGQEEASIDKAVAFLKSLSQKSKVDPKG